jgi:hypothetical protein
MVPLSRLRLELLETRDLLSGVWTPLTNLAPSPDGMGTMTLLSDGTIMVQGGGSNDAVNAWYQLTPDNLGDYTNGTWGQLASMSLERLYFGSNVLPDGRVFLVGGEYTGPDTQITWINQGEIYDPVADAWSPITDFPQSQFGDDPTMVLQDGRILAGFRNGPETYLYDPATDTWTQTGTKLANDRSDEETWLLLPDGSVLTYDVFNNGHAQRYDPASGTWLDAGTVPVNLSSSPEDEMGPATMLPDGRAFFVGATNHTALYDPSTNTWTAGPDLPTGMGADDTAGALLPNGHFLFAVDKPSYRPPTILLDFDPVTNTLRQVDVPDEVGLATTRGYYTRMLELPDQQILFTAGSNQLWIYTPDQTVDPSLKPVISDLQDNGDGTFTLSGTLLNGSSAGASYGDDAEMDSNYPVVFLTDANGNVTYGRTFNWAPGLVQSGDLVTSTEFTLPAGIAPGDYSLQVSAAGIISDPIDFQVPCPPLQPGQPVPVSATPIGMAVGQPVTLAPVTLSLERVSPGAAPFFPNTSATPAFGSTTTTDASTVAVADMSPKSATVTDSRSPLLVTNVDTRKSTLDFIFSGELLLPAI